MDVVSLFVPHLSIFWCLAKAVLRDYGISYVSSLIFLLIFYRLFVFYYSRNYQNLDVFFLTQCANAKFPWPQVKQLSFL